MGEVWLAQDTTLRRQVAIKLLPSVVKTDSVYLRDFAYEARAAAALEHPHILPVHDFGEQYVSHDEVITYLVTPYISSGSLRDRIRRSDGPLPTPEAMLYLRYAAGAIDYAHSQNMLHRDIKPANMLLQDDWLLLADFGLAKILNNTTSRSRTHAGAGTPEYMAPEQAMGKAVPASDRYSLATVAYQLFTGQVPFHADTPYELMIKQVREVPTSPRHFNSSIPVGVEQVLLKGLAKQPEERPTTCNTFVDELENAWRGAMPREHDPDATMLAPWSKRWQSENVAYSPPDVPAPMLYLT
jgi:serine/threonine protein kinase